MRTLFENKTTNNEDKHFFDLIKAFPAEELYRLVVDGSLHAEENGWVGYENREPGCLQAFFDAFLFICQNKNSPLTVEYIQTIQALCSSFMNLTPRVWLPGTLYNDKHLPTLTFQARIYDHSFSIPHDRATVDGITEYLDQNKNKSNYIVGRIGYDRTDLVSGAFGFKDNRKLAEYILNRMSAEGNCLFYHAPRTDVYQSLSMIICSYQKEISQAQNSQEEKLYIIANHIQLFEKLHPFPDINGRTFVNLLLNRMLMQNGFGLAIFEEPNLFDLYSVSELVVVIKKAIENAQQIKQGNALFGFDTQTMSAKDKRRFTEICRTFTEGMTPAKEKKQQELLTQFKIENYLEYQYPKILRQQYLDNKNELDNIKKEYPGYGYNRLFTLLTDRQVIRDASYLNGLYTKLHDASEGKINIKDLRYQLDIDLMKMHRDVENKIFGKACHNYLSKVIFDLDKLLVLNDSTNETEEDKTTSVRFI